jgi:hypothetical protein
MDVASMVISLLALLLVLYFFKLSTDQANRIEDASNAIKASAGRNPQEGSRPSCGRAVLTQ